MAGNSGPSKSEELGSARALGLTGRTEIRFPHRLRAILVPSLSMASPFRSASLFLVQKTLLPIR